ncbi:hypothetical protein KR032_001261 [Drosophila birchii]|nr:hypothetical protein KR032_001261 [Drosophila birchii]
MDSLASLEGALSSARNRGRMPQIPEEQVEISQRANASRGGVCLFHSNNTNIASGVRNNHCSRNQNDEFKDCEYCVINASQLKFFRDLKNLTTNLDIAIAEYKKAQAPPVETVLRPFEAYVKETDKLIKKLLAEIAEREMA